MLLLHGNIRYLAESKSYVTLNIKLHPTIKWIGLPLMRACTIWPKHIIEFETTTAYFLHL